MLAGAGRRSRTGGAVTEVELGDPVQHVVQLVHSAHARRQKTLLQRLGHRATLLIAQAAAVRCRRQRS